MLNPTTLTCKVPCECLVLVLKKYSSSSVERTGHKTCHWIICLFYTLLKKVTRKQLICTKRFCTNRSASRTMQQLCWVPSPLWVCLIETQARWTLIFFDQSICKHLHSVQNVCSEKSLAKGMDVACGVYVNIREGYFMYTWSINSGCGRGMGKRVGLHTASITFKMARSS